MTASPSSRPSWSAGCARLRRGRPGPGDDPRRAALPRRTHPSRRTSRSAGVRPAMGLFGRMYVAQVALAIERRARTPAGRNLGRGDTAARAAASIATGPDAVAQAWGAVQDRHGRHRPPPAKSRDQVRAVLVERGLTDVRAAARAAPGTGQIGVSPRALAVARRRGPGEAQRPSPPARRRDNDSPNGRRWRACWPPSSTPSPTGARSRHGSRRSKVTPTATSSATATDTSATSTASAGGAAGRTGRTAGSTGADPPVCPGPPPPDP
jgi:hypothetical protein